MTETSWALIGIAITIMIAGASLYWQGEAMKKGVNPEKLGRMLRFWGLFFAILGIVYIILIYIFKPG